MAYDSTRHVVLLQGARGTWTRTDQDWLLRSSFVTSGARMAFDSARGVAVLLKDADTYEWNNSTWTLRSSAGPAARAWYGMAYDASRARTVLFGGSDPANSAPRSGDTWEWDGNAWTQVATTGPSVRDRLAVAYDPTRQLTVLFGGRTSAGGAQSGETWEWNGTAWTLRASSGPSSRADAAMAFDTAKNWTLLVGGIHDSTILADTWSWDGNAWFADAVNGSPTARCRHAIAYDGALKRIVLFGGVGDDAGVSRETWEVQTIASCDSNCDGTSNVFDLQPFVSDLTGASTPCSPCASDSNGDGSVNQFDIQGFIDCLIG